MEHRYMVVAKDRMLGFFDAESKQDAISLARVYSKGRKMQAIRI